ncbi:beta-galactosidase-1-like protein 2 isoform X2 [Octodon degus]|nr:beta-galactosidase-1-like protein 2 isoform X2 [Octodon degus]XP_023559592.1 beta-galactosidase-1-like protein 2 isoform X2 [Octodon degus]XP_023559593.1 beta-galactosidase-1-like protein 2 isoform X2 [Octodon degus]XP_023559596.1 beta-galactosidase-1-like protein 2 isoform X2 [Octodon degus]
MGTFLVRLDCILYLSSAFSVMAQLCHNEGTRINQSLLTPSHLQSRRVGLKVAGLNFTLEDSPFLILAGTIHYFRVPREYWRDRLLKLKACGFNTVSTHVPWNLHEPMRGQFHFAGNLDFMSFISVASELGLWVILCPGPYIGSDLDLGGLPSWLLQDPKMKLRTTYRGFQKAVNRYFDQLIPRIALLQYSKGGPIIAVQIENEYGSYHQDRKYMSFIKKALQRRKIKELLITADKGLELRQGHLKNVLATLHLKDIQKKSYEDLFRMQGRGPVLMMVYTSRSFDTWGEIRRIQDAHMLRKDVLEMFKLRFSLNFYMFHGGTNFGFMSGAEALDIYLPAVTSYDYGALLTEDGSYTPEYIVLRELLQSVTDVPPSLPPEQISKVAYKSVTRLHFMSLWDILPYLGKPIRSAKPISMEQLPVNKGSGQAYGYILYETAISKGGFLTSRGHVQDRGQVFLNEKYLGVLDHSTNQLYIKGFYGTHILRILVENQGRLACGRDMSKERKGLIGDLYLDNSPLRNFAIYSLEMKTTFLKRDLPNLWKPVTKDVRGPAFFLAFLRVGDFPQDTFIKLKGWKKGVIFINGRNLGRYWDVGPQETLYLPGPWLQPGSNEIVLFEEWASGQQIEFTKEPFLGY